MDKEKITANGVSNGKCEIQLAGCKNNDGRSNSQSITFTRSGKNASICSSCLKKKLVTNWTY